MADERPLVEQILDVAVFAPVGAVTLASEQLPALVAKGRSVVEGRVNVARMVGRFAVAMARRRVEDAMGGAGPGAPSSPSEAPARPTAPARPGTPARPGAGTRQDTGAGEPRDGGSGRAGTRGGAGGGGGRTPRAPVEVPDVGELAIPGYDSLAASQVVRRLDSLTRAELASVQAYEEATRGRRTILGRIAQLQGRADAGA
ncbi:MAG: hypothetical protein ACYCTE_14345 [Acidimicrobiales bacterium]